MADLGLAMIIAVVTFKVAYRASVVLGTVLLQTSPPRGLASGKMEAFLRAMREVCPVSNFVHDPALPEYLKGGAASSRSSPSRASHLATDTQLRVIRGTFVLFPRLIKTRALGIPSCNSRAACARRPGRR